MGRCPNCQQSLNEGDTRCSACGTELVNKLGLLVRDAADGLATLDGLPIDRISEMADAKEPTVVHETISNPSDTTDYLGPRWATLDGPATESANLNTLDLAESASKTQSTFSLDDDSSAKLTIDPSPLDTADFDDPNLATIAGDVPADDQHYSTWSEEQSADPSSATLNLPEASGGIQPQMLTLDSPDAESTDDDPSGTWSLDSIAAGSPTGLDSSSTSSDNIATLALDAAAPQADPQDAEDAGDNFQTMDGPIGKLSTMATLDSNSPNFSSMSTLDSHVDDAAGDSTLDSHSPSQDSLATIDSKSLPMDADPYATLDDLSEGDPHKTDPPNAPNSQTGSASVKSSQQTVANKSVASSASRSAKSGVGQEDRFRTVGSQAMSGSSGRLRRMWDGVAGSSQNPMHSLKAEGLAVDAEIQRVAIRKLVENDETVGESGDYQMLKKLGEGAMGVVYSAKQTAIDRVIALKAIKQEQRNSTDSRRKFLYEAQITGELDHPNIVPIHELGASEDGMLFYSMKLVNGTPWQHVIKTKSIDENVEILMKVADAIAFAHNKQIIHRDLKPENIMLGTFGEVLVMDWGLAVNTRSSKNFSLGGTPAYMAPEMAAHNIAKIGPASDVYLLGAMLYQVVNGIPPHPGKTVNECLRAALKNQIIPPSSSHALLDIAMRAMATEVGDRYATVAQMQEAIREYRRHAESIALANRSEDLLNQAIRNKDYQAFSRSLFGFRDAVELWKDNPAAHSGLKRCRLAYGQCALERGDYDLCLQTLDRSNSTENILFVEAESKRTEARGRERRLKSLKRTVSIVIIAALVGVSGLATVAWWQRGIAIQKEKLAVEAREETTRALQAETQALQQAQNDRDVAVSARKAESAALGVAQRERDNAVVAKKVADEARQKEEQAKLEVSHKADEIQIGNFQSNLSLAIAQFAQYDTVKGKQSLDSAKLSLESLLSTNKPRFDSWATRRAALLGNIDLDRIQNPSSVSVIAFAAEAQRGAFGTIDGRVQVFDMVGGKLEILPPLAQQHPATTVEGIALSPDAKSVVYSIAAQDKTNKVFLWRLGESKPEELQSTNNRSFQAFAFDHSGLRVIGGINGGVWFWQRESTQDTKWHNQPASFVFENIRGQLRSIHFMNSNANKGIAVVEFEGDLFCHLLDFQQRTSRLLSVDQMLGTAENRTPNGVMSGKARINKGRITAIAYAESMNLLIFGSAQGRIFVSGLDTAGNQGSIEELLPAVHQTAVSSITVHPTSGTLLTTGIDSVVHVWQRTDDHKKWMYDSYLIGTSGNIHAALFAVSADDVIGVDEHGQMIVWSIAKQKQRRQMLPLNSAGQVQSFSAPILSTGPSSDGKIALALDANGVLYKWSLANGRVQAFAEQQVANYFGHTPGARFVDMAIDHSTETLVTSALLTSDSEGYVNPTTNIAEYCQWSLRSGTMLRRWTRASKIEPRISLLNGKGIIYASDDATRIESLDVSSNTMFSNDNFGTFFASPHPLTPNWILLTKRTGAVRMFNLDDHSSWDNADLFVNQLANNADPPMQSTWSPDGRRFYVGFTSGRIARFTWNGKEIGNPQIKDFSNELNLTGVRPQSWRDLDLLVRSEGGQEVVYVAARLPGSVHQTKSAKIIFDAPDQKPPAQHEDFDGRQWLVSRRGQTTPSMLAGSPTVQKVLELNGSSILATSDCGIFHVSSNQSFPTSVLARKQVLSASWNALGNRLVTLQEGGGIWWAEIADGKDIAWAPIPIKSNDISQVRISPQGNHLLLLRTSHESHSAQIIDLPSGKTVREMPEVVAGAWGSRGEFATCDVRGAVRFYAEVSADPVELTRSADSRLFHECKELRFFGETWQGNRETSMYVALVTQSEKADRLELIPTVSQQMESSPARSTLLPTIEFPRDSLTALATSPTDSVLVVGDRSGTVSVWYSAASLDGKLHQLFTLEGHRGAKIESLTFTPDGTTLISTDDQLRVFAWLSNDPSK